MGTLLKLFKRFLQEEDGQTSVEYILLVAVAAMLVMKFGNTAKAKLGALTEKVFGKADNMLNEF